MTVLILPVYTVIPNKDKYSIRKENGDLVGKDWIWEFKIEAEAYLNRLVAMNYCQKGK